MWPTNIIPICIVKFINMIRSRGTILNSYDLINMSVMGSNLMFLSKSRYMVMFMVIGMVAWY